MNEQRITPPEIVEGLKELGFEVVERTSLETKLEKGDYQVTIPMKKIDSEQAEEIKQALEPMTGELPSLNPLLSRISTGFGSGT